MSIGVVDAPAEIEGVPRLGERVALRSWLLLGITLAALGLRLFRLGEWSFWGDEMITVNRALALADLPLWRWAPSLVLTRLAIDWLGVTEWAARLPAALAGTATVPLLYWLGRRMLSERAALAGAAILAVSPWHLYWSQNARFYAFLLLFYTLALGLFYLGLERDRIPLLAASLVFLGLAAMERLLALFLVPTLGLYVLLLWRGGWFSRPTGWRWRNLLVYAAPGVLPAALLVASVPAVQDPATWQRSFAWVNNHPFWVLAGAAYYIGLPVLLFALAGGVERVKSRDRAGLLLTLSALAPLAGTALVAMVQYSANRYAFVSLTAWVLLAGVAVEGLWRVARARAGVLFAGAAIAILFGVLLAENVLYYGVQNGNRDDWKGAFQYVQQRRQPGDAVVSANRVLADYYFGEGTIGLKTADLTRFEAEGRRAWFVVDMTAKDRWPDQVRWVLRNARLMATFDVHFLARTFEMRVYLYAP